MLDSVQLEVYYGLKYVTEKRISPGEAEAMCALIELTQESQPLTSEHVRKKLDTTPGRVSTLLTGLKRKGVITNVVRGVVRFV